MHTLMFFQCSVPNIAQECPTSPYCFTTLHGVK